MYQVEEIDDINCKKSIKKIYLTMWRFTPMHITYIKRTSQRTQTVSIIKTSVLMLFEEVIVFYFEILTNRMYTV